MGRRHVLGVFGISPAALRIAGGLAVAVQAWARLSAAEDHEERKGRPPVPRARR